MDPLVRLPGRPLGDRLTRRAAAGAAVATAALVLPGAAFAHGGAEHSDLASAWSADVLVLAVAGLGVALFAQAFTRLRRRGRPDHAPWRRAALFGAGTTIGVLAVISPLDAVGERELLSGHMLQHVLIADLVPALLLLAVRGPLLFFLLPGFLLAPLARLRGARRALGLLLVPAVALLFWATTVAVWHVPSAYDAVLDNGALHAFEHASFFLAGLLVWYQLVDPAGHGSLSRYGRLGLAMLLVVLGMALSNTLILAGKPLYPAYADLGERLFGLSPVSDQVAAGLVMMVEQVVVLGTAAFVLLRSVFRATAAAEDVEARHPLAY